MNPPSSPPSKDFTPNSLTRQHTGASHVPYDHFANSSSVQQLDVSRPDVDSGATSAVDTLVGDKDSFHFDRFLQDKWDRLTEAGINKRETGVTFKDLRVTGLGANAKYQDTIFSLLNPLGLLDAIQNFRHPPVKDILHGFEGDVRPGEMVLVLGRPGSGCSTFLKVLANQHAGFHSVEGQLSYDGISPEYMAKHYRGDIGYSPEDDVHFPSLTVKQTLAVSAATRAPQKRLPGYTRQDYINTIVDTLGTVFGLKHAFNTAVGDQNIRGVSGGEKKRVSIAEMMSMRVTVACWDNSTRGLDASTALEFTRALRIATDIAKVASIVSIYQASENIYQMFDKVVVINEGRMAYFGPADQAREYFIDMGYEPANRQTTADFLVGVTHALSRTPRAGMESRVPRTPAEFSDYFKNSHLGKQNGLSVHNQLFETPREQKRASYKVSARQERAKHMPPGSPYTVSLAMQVRVLMRRRVQIILGDLVTQSIMLFNFIAQGLIMGSVFFKMPDATSAYFSRGGTLFFAVLFGALSSMAEIPALYTQRPIVARHHKAALYHPFVDALALTLVDIPITVTTILVFDLLLYFMTGLQRHASNFFIFLLFTFAVSLSMKGFYRGLAASFNQEATAQAVAGLGTLVLVIYTGFTIPRPSMIGALRWITYINPIKYGFEAIVANEFHGLNGVCSSLVPTGAGYEGVSLANQVCTVVGSVPGQRTVSGDAFIASNYGYQYSNLWRNFGITMAFWIGFLAWFFYSTERDGSHSGGVTQLVFKRGASIPDVKSSVGDEEKGSTSVPSTDVASSDRERDAEMAKAALPQSRGTFSWHHLNYDVTVSGGGKRRLLDDVSGFVVPGKLTALMGESGAGKTTLLNALADRLGTGVISGDRFVNGSPLPTDFAAQTGYCQQMDIHLETATVREALRFSAVLRQPATVSREEKYAYVEEVIQMCEMGAYADAVVGQVGEGLNVEQRKRLTIGVELAAKPQLLLFLDEPTSGLDSQSAWAVIDFLRSLADRGQAILCTIHQPSAELFQSFDRLLLLRKGGQTCFFGDLGNNATTLIQYFERNGGRKCEEGENPAEYMLDVIGAGATAHSDVDWHAAWKNAAERLEMETELDRLLRAGKKDAVGTRMKHGQVFAASYGVQFAELMRRAFQNYIRSGTYLISKFAVNIFSGLFIGFTFFKAKNTIQGSQNQLFAIFMGTILAVPLSNMLQVPFLHFRNIYEVRERASKMYHWIPMITTSLIVELPFNILGSSLFFLCWYWTVGFPGTASRVGFQYLGYGVVFPVYYTTISQAVAAASPNAQIAGLLFSFLFSFTITFNGVLQPFSQLVPFWHWMYRLSPFTYLIEALLTNGIGNQAIQCSSNEIVTITPPTSRTCQDYMSSYIDRAGGYLLNPTATSDCQFCSTSMTNSYLASLNMSFSHRWRDIGFLAAYIMFNISIIYIFTYIFRIRSGNPFRSLRSVFARRSKKSN